MEVLNLDDLRFEVKDGEKTEWSERLLRLDK